MPTGESPRSLAADTAVPGSIMLEPDYTVDVSRTAGAELFYRCGHLRLCEAMLCPIRQSPGDSFDAIPVRDRPTGKNKTAYPDETGCLLRLFETSSSVAHASHYAKVVMDRSMFHKLDELSRRFQNGSVTRRAGRPGCATTSLALNVAQDLLLTGDVVMRISLLELACLALAKGPLDPNSLITDARVPVLLLSHLNRAPPA